MKNFVGVIFMYELVYDPRDETWFIIKRGKYGLGWVVDTDYPPAPTQEGYENVVRLLNKEAAEY